jgi:hypothetical protein
LSNMSIPCSKNCFRIRSTLRTDKW